jgi:hypothetical protein
MNDLALGTWTAEGKVDIVDKHLSSNMEPPFKRVLSFIYNFGHNRQY